MEWTSKDIEQLKIYAAQYTVKEISKLMNRSQKAIYSKLKYLKLSITHDEVYWAKSDVEKLLKMHDKGYHTVEISHLLNRSEDAIVKKLWKLGKSFSGRKCWTKEDEEYLLDNYGKLRLKHICNKLNRRPSAIYVKLNKLGVTSIKDNGYYTLNQLSKLCYKSQKYLINNIENEELTAMKKHITMHSRKTFMIKAEDFWFYAKWHKKDFRFSLIEKDSIPVEPDWVELERQKEIDIFTYKGWSNEQISKLRQLFDTGFDYEVIASKIGRTKNAVMCKLNDLGLKRQIQIRYSKKEIEIIFDLLKDGKKIKEIAEEIGRSYDQLRGKIRRMKSNGTFEYYTNKAKMAKVRSIMTDDAEIEGLLDIINR